MVPKSLIDRGWDMAKGEVNFDVMLATTSSRRPPRRVRAFTWDLRRRKRTSSGYLSRMQAYRQFGNSVVVLVFAA